MATINNAIAQFKKKNLHVNGVCAVSAQMDKTEECIKVSVENLSKYKHKFPKEFLGHRLILEDAVVNKG